MVLIFVNILFSPHYNINVTNKNIFLVKFMNILVILFNNVK